MRITTIIIAANLKKDVFQVFIWKCYGTLFLCICFIKLLRYYELYIILIISLYFLHVKSQSEPLSEPSEKWHRLRVSLYVPLESFFTSYELSCLWAQLMWLVRYLRPIYVVLRWLWVLKDVHGVFFYLCMQSEHVALFYDLCFGMADQSSLETLILFKKKKFFFCKWKIEIFYFVPARLHWTWWQIKTSVQVSDNSAML